MLSIRLESVEVLMHQRGIRTRKELADRMGIRPTHLSRALAGNHGPNGPGVSIANGLCTALQCQPGDFLLWQPPNDKKVNPEVNPETPAVPIPPPMAETVLERLRKSSDLRAASSSGA